MNKYVKSAIEKNTYAEEWHKVEKNKKIPSVYKKVKFVEYREFAAKILEQSPEFVRSVVDSLYAGDMFIIKNGNIFCESHAFTIIFFP